VTYDREKLRRQLKLHEGFRSHAYQDSLGFWTIGIGRLIDKRKGGGITEDEAYYLLENDIIEKERELFARFPWIGKLDDARQRVLLDMAFNLGVPGLAGFKNTLAHVEAGRYAQAAENMLKSKWASQVGIRARRLAKAMETGTLEI
jgi:lysozyme